MSNSIKFAGKNDSDLVTPVSVSDEGFIRESRKFKVTYTNIIDEVLSITEETRYPSHDARESGLIALYVFNRSGVDLTVKFNSPMHQSDSGTSVGVVNIKQDVMSFTAQHNKVTIVTPEDFPMLNYLQYLNISITPADTPTGTSKTIVRVIEKG